MVEYFRTRARPWRLIRGLLQSAAALALFAMFTNLSALAQNGAARNNSAQAVLHIRVNIIPVVMAPPPMEPNLPPATAVTYNIPVSKSKVQVIEETRPFSPANSNRMGPQGAVLRTLTIVTR